MTPSDFLNTRADTPLHDLFLVAGAVGELSTNSESILEAARASFLPVHTLHPSVDLRLRLWVDATARDTPPWPKPRLRGLEHLVFGGFDSGSSLLIDRRARRVIGRFSPAMAADGAYWKRTIFSNLLTALGGAIGVAELHCACVVRADCGLLLAGGSGSGKSTLALALAQQECAFLSDDRTWVSWRDSRLRAWGLPTFLKLRPDAIAFFPEIDCEPKVIQDGQRVLQIDGENHPGLERALCCEPRAVVFLERGGASTDSLTRMSDEEAAARLGQDLIPEAPNAVKHQWETIDRLVGQGCWLLRYGGTPQATAAALVRLLDARPKSQSSVPYLPTRIVAPPETASADPFRLLTPTPHAVKLELMGRVVKLETNSPAIFNAAHRLFAPCVGTDNGVEGKPSAIGGPTFRWRIVADAGLADQPPWPLRAVFSDECTRYASFGHRNFVAADLESCKAVGFLAEGLACDEPGFRTVFLDTLFCMTAGALGLTPVFSACIALEGRGLLVFGAPNSGKTTSSYLACEMGAEFHADQATFLDLQEDGTLRAWTGFLPALFRPDTLQFLPALRRLTRPLRYLNSTFLELDIAASRLGCSAKVAPIGWVFLRRGASSVPHLNPLERNERVALLENHLLFKEHRRFEGQRRATLAALAELPGYSLAYGDDPADAAVFFRTLLGGEPAVEAKTGTEN